MGLKTIHPCFRFSHQKTSRLVDILRCEQHTYFLFAMFRFVWAWNTPNSNRVSYLSITNQQFTVYPIYVPLTNPLRHHGNMSYFSFGIGIDPSLRENLEETFPILSLSLQTYSKVRFFDIVQTYTSFPSSKSCSRTHFGHVQTIGFPSPSACNPSEPRLGPPTILCRFPAPH